MKTETTIEKVFGKNVLVHNNLKMLAMSSASMIVTECRAWRPNPEKTNYPNLGTVLGDLTHHTNWSQNGFIAALQSHVNVVYAVVKYNLEIPTSDLWLEYHEALFLTDALETYQKWKETVIRKRKEMYGEDHGSATGFNCAVWDDNNEALLDLYRG